MATESKTTLIRGGTVVLGHTVSQQDVLIRGERIAAVGRLSGSKADTTLDAGGLLVLPGAVDTHVHYNDVFMNTVSVHDYYTGTLAAAYGGVTTVVDFSNQLHGEPLIDTLEYKRQEAGNLPLVDWGVHPCITDPTPETLDQIPLVVAEGAPSIKCYMTYREDGLYVGAEGLQLIAQRLRRRHCRHYVYGFRRSDPALGRHVRGDRRLAARGRRLRLDLQPASRVETAVRRNGAGRFGIVGPAQAIPGPHSQFGVL
jgi:dihydroorotase-like cyclic amidohydrolase